MTEGSLTPNMQKWTDDLQSFGKVEISAAFKSLIWRVGLAVIIIAIFLWAQYNSGNIGQTGLTWGIVGFVALIVGLIAFVKIKWGDSNLTIDRDGVQTFDGHRIPWTDITDVSVYNAPRSGSALQINVTQEAWDALPGRPESGRQDHAQRQQVRHSQSWFRPAGIPWRQSTRVGGLDESISSSSTGVDRSLMSATESTSRLIQEVASTGRITIRTNGRLLIVLFVFIVVIFFAGAMYGYVANDGDTPILIVGTMIPLIIVLIGFLSHRAYANRVLVIEQTGVTLLDGQFVEWADVEDVGIFRSSRSAPAVYLVLSERAWETYMSRRNFGGKLLNQLNSAVMRKRANYLPAYLSESNNDVGALVRFFISGHAHDRT